MLASRRRLYCALTAVEVSAQELDGLAHGELVGVVIPGDGKNCVIFFQKLRRLVADADFAVDRELSKSVILCCGQPGELIVIGIDVMGVFLQQQAC